MLPRNPLILRFMWVKVLQKIDEMMTSILDLESSLNSANESYKNMSADIEERLTALETREELITTRYTAQFGDMEKSMTQFNSTKTLLENFIEAWKNRKIKTLKSIFFTFSIKVVLRSFKSFAASLVFPSFLFNAPL